MIVCILKLSLKMNNYKVLNAQYYRYFSMESNSENILLNPLLYDVDIFIISICYSEEISNSKDHTHKSGANNKTVVNFAATQSIF